MDLIPIWLWVVFGLFAGVIAGWSTPEPAWAAALRVRIFGIASQKFIDIEQKIRGK